MSETPFDVPERNLTTGPGESTRPWTEVPTTEPTAAGPVPVDPAAPTRLVIKRGPDAGTGFPVTAPCTTIGRHRDCDVVLDDCTVSRYHAELHHHGGRYTIADAGSLNGTYLNRQPVDRAELADGDEIWIGKFHLRFQLSR
jgi:pSer/pThr/pTyr-binding forkhead associated (FHA) protein